MSHRKQISSVCESFIFSFNTCFVSFVLSLACPGLIPVLGVCMYLSINVHEVLQWPIMLLFTEHCNTAMFLTFKSWGFLPQLKMYVHYCACGHGISGPYIQRIYSSACPMEIVKQREAQRTVLVQCVGLPYITTSFLLQYNLLHQVLFL